MENQIEKKMEIKVETGFQTRRVQGVGYRVKGHRYVVGVV